MNNDIFFSIVIPIYNGLSHDLPICLDSIWSQDLSANLYEVICVDDCSTDDSLEWLREQQEKHKNLKIIRNKTNRRQGGARNNGIENASGKFLMFIDQDDYFHPDSLGILYDNLVGNDVEILIADSAYQIKGHESNKKQLNFRYTDKMKGEDFIKKNGFAISPWRFILRMDFYKFLDLKFEENCRLEDDWAVRVLYYANKVQYAPFILVHYNKDVTSTTDNMHHNPSILKDNVLCGNRILEVGNNIYKGSPIQEMVFNLASTYYICSIKNMMGLLSSIETKKEIIGLIPDIRTNNKYVKLAKDFPLIFAVLSNITVPLFSFLRTWKRKRLASKFNCQI